MTKHIDRLTRYEADIVVRQLTGRYYEKYGYGASSFHTEERFADFCGCLASYIDGDGNGDFHAYLEAVLYSIHELDNDYWAYRADNSRRDYWVEQRDEAITNALNAAKIAVPA